jgi:HemY protein
MRGVIWLVLLFAAAVVAASTLGRNDGLVSVFWQGWRVDVSLNLFLLALVLLCVALVASLQSINALLSLPRRAKAWRLTQRDRGAQQQLRETLVALWSGRFARAHKGAERLLSIQAKSPELQADGDAVALAHLLAAESAHRLQDKGRRQMHWESALQAGGNRTHAEAARLMAAGWALDDREAAEALRHLESLGPGAGRRTQALRLRLQAARLGGQPLEALRTARLLAKHQGFSATVASSLIRSLAFEVLDAARDADQLRQAWLQLDAADRRDAFVASRAAVGLARWGAAADARAWIKPLWETLANRAEDERHVLARALSQCTIGMGVEWLPKLEAAVTQWPRETYLQLVLGLALAELQLWGKARQLLTTVAGDARLPADDRRRAWLRLAEMANEAGDTSQRASDLEQAAQLLV